MNFLSIFVFSYIKFDFESGKITNKMYFSFKIIIKILVVVNIIEM
jgi:hypothetical protein